MREMGRGDASLQKELCWVSLHSDLEWGRPVQKPRPRGERERQASGGQEQGEAWVGGDPLRGRRC